MCRSFINVALLSPFLLCIFSLLGKTEQPDKSEKDKKPEMKAERRGGFTGPKVPSLPTIMGDYCCWGARTKEGRTDIPKLMKVLKEMGAKDYMHLVFQEKVYPKAWDDFLLMAPQFQKANIRLWLYLCPPSIGGSAPFGKDYVRWAKECATVAKKYPVVRGIFLDDFQWAPNIKVFTPAYCKKFMDAAHEIAPHLSLLVGIYIGGITVIEEHVKKGAIDGVFYPYFHPRWPARDNSHLENTIRLFRLTFDKWTKDGGQKKKMPLVVMIYSTKHSAHKDMPTPNSVREGLTIGLKATKAGLADGVMTYILPKDDPAFVRAIGEVYRAWDAGNLLPLAEDLRLPATVRNLLADAKLSGNMDVFDKGLRGKPAEIVFDTEKGKFLAPSKFLEYGVGFGRNLGVVKEEKAAYWMAEWKKPIEANWMVFSGAYANQPQQETAWKIEIRQSGKWAVHAKGTGGWYDRGRYVWGLAGAKAIRFDALRVSVFSKDEKTELKGVHFRGEAKLSWVVAMVPAKKAK